MTEKQAQTRLMQYCLAEKNHAAAVPNSTQLLYSEADLLSVTKAGLVHEYEIKCSYSDYQREISGSARYGKTAKHQLLQNSGIYPRNESKIPNYFWFVTFGFLIEPPEYAGWILLTPNPATGAWLSLEEKPEDEALIIRLEVKKEAPRLHGNKWQAEDVARIARLLSYRLLSVYEKETGIK